LFRLQPEPTPSSNTRTSTPARARADSASQKARPDFIRINDVSLEVDRLFRGANGVEHGREIFVTILQDFDCIAFDWHWIGHGERRGEEFRIAYGKRVLEMIFQRMPADEENAEQRNDCAECQD